MEVLQWNSPDKQRFTCKKRKILKTRACAAEGRAEGDAGGGGAPGPLHHARPAWARPGGRRLRGRRDARGGRRAAPRECPPCWTAAAAAWCAPGSAARAAPLCCPATRAAASTATAAPRTAAAPASAWVGAAGRAGRADLSLWNALAFLTSAGRGQLRVRWDDLPQRGDVPAQLQVPVHLPGRADRVPAPLQPGPAAPRPRLPLPAEDRSPRRVLREVGVRPQGWSAPGRLCYGWWGTKTPYRSC